MATATETAGTGVRWETSFHAAEERARKEGKPILIDFSAAPQ